MTSEQKSYLISQLSLLLDKMVDDVPAEQKTSVSDNAPREMLTMNECLETVKGLTYHSLRVLIARGEIQSIRLGTSERGRILVPKNSLLAYFDRL